MKKINKPIKSIIQLLISSYIKLKFKYAISNQTIKRTINEIANINFFLFVVNNTLSTTARTSFQIFFSGM